MSIEYYGATADAQENVNRMLGIAAVGKEQDWEIEFADPSKIGLMLDVLEREPLDLDSRTALCLLVVASFEEAMESGSPIEEYAARAAQLIGEDSTVLERMRFYWMGLRRTSFPERIGKLLCT